MDAQHVCAIHFERVVNSIRDPDECCIARRADCTAGSSRNISASTGARTFVAINRSGFPISPIIRPFASSQFPARECKNAAPRKPG